MQMRSQPPPSPHRDYSHAPDLCLLQSALTWGIDECSFDLAMNLLSHPISSSEEYAQNDQPSPTGNRLQ